MTADPLRILVVSRRAPFPFSYDGGAQRSTAWLAGALARRGHQVETLGSYRDDELEPGLEACSRLGVECVRGGDAIRGVHGQVRLRIVHRADFEAACRALLDGRDLVVTQLEGSGLAASVAGARGIPTVLRLVGPPTSDTCPDIGPHVLPVANSPLTAKMGADRYHRPIGFIITPVEKYVPGKHAPHYVTFVNPRRDKGLHLFARIAASRPRLPFLVVLGWQGHPYDSDERRALSFLRQLHNVEFRHSVVEMSEVYEQTKVLLVPSRWPESWPRVVGEAQVHGIPILGSDVGCVPHAIGGGGVVLPYADPDLWCQVLDRVCADGDRWRELSRAARDSVMRFDDERVMDLWSTALQAALRGEPWAGGEAPGEVQILRARRDREGHLEWSPDRIVMNEVQYAEPGHP